MKVQAISRRPLASLSAAIIVSVLLVTLNVTAAGAAQLTPVPGQSEQGAAVFHVEGALDLDRFGYSLSEFFIEGAADSYHNVGPLTNSSKWAVEPDGNLQPFKTRFQVLAPTDPSAFNGTVYVEWLNVSAGIDSAPDWGFTHVEMQRQGAIYIGASAQLVGVNSLTNNFPDRYGTLSHPGDSYSYDIFRQIGQALQDQPDEIFGAAYEPQRFIATGESQSAGRMTTFVNAFSDADVFGGYLIHSRGAQSAALRQAPLAPITTPSPTMIADLDEPVLTFQSETDSRLARQSDGPTFRWWEVGGTAHVDAYIALVASLDDGTGPDAARQYFDRMINVFTGPISTFGSCQLGVNAGPHVYVLQAALRHLNAWVTEGTLPPAAARLATTDGTGAGALVLDGNGNATGGIRTPHLDVPIATLRGTGNSPATPGINFCALFGTTTPFTAEKLAQLYKNHGQFVSPWNQSVDATVAAGFMTPEDGEFVKAAAAGSSIGKH